MRRTLCLALLGGIWVPLLAGAQQVIEVTPAQGLTGVTNVTAGVEVQVYAVQLLDNTNDARSAELGPSPGANGINVTISDLAVATGLVSADLTELRLYRSADAVFDAGDTFLKAATPVNIGAVTTIDVTAVPNPNKSIPETPAASIYFIVTARIGPDAVPGRAFRLGAAANHINIHESGGGPPSDYSMGSAILANDANRIVFIAGGQQVIIHVPSATIPLMPTGMYGLLALCFLAYGIYALKARPR